MSLIKKHCVPCEDKDMKPLTKTEAKKLLTEIPVWEIDESGHKISRTFELTNFVEAVDMINKIADIAEEEGHHPDLVLFGYKNLTVELSTHSIGGLSENDFIVAARIDGIANFGKI